MVNAAAPLLPDDGRLIGPIYTLGTVRRDHVGQVPALRASARGTLRPADVASRRCRSSTSSGIRSLPRVAA